ncbi:hypothetical protein [Arthrobacter cavernae]|uniref:Uncharacterized protein n=1 Tax=Arthrobacter cavernae TaxID=2817681 RepID=A0A939HHV3_9MICC|nr:hypothetical protein [Arthrobacter cavernae]MBO1268136.1 hypothetical protein [Arthrobacter cavernae]
MVGVRILLERGWILHAAARFPEAMVEFQLAEQWAGRVGTENQQIRAREAINECGKSLAGGHWERL